MRKDIKNYINERWAKNRDTVACVPETETHYPGVYIESAAHPINHDAKLKLFVEQYVHLTRDESIVDFHKLDKSGRYDKAILLMPVPMSLNTAVIVRGQYESIYDSAEAKNKSLPPEFLGYKEIRYIVETSFPESNVKNDWENKDGFYVIWSSERDVPLGEATLLQRKSREKLIRNNN